MVRTDTPQEGVAALVAAGDEQGDVLVAVVVHGQQGEAELLVAVVLGGMCGEGREGQAKGQGADG